MKHKKLLFLILILFSFSILNAQLKQFYEKGQITIKNGEIKQGYIRNDDFKHKIDKVCFKLSLTDEKCRFYDTSEIVSFKTENGEIYDVIETSLNNNTSPITLFAKKILNGKTSLYKGLHEKSVFYIISKKDKNYILQNDKFISGQTKVSRYNYVGILNLATENLPIKTNTTILYKEQVFIDILSKYNTSKGDDFEIIKTKEKPVRFYILTAGIGFGNSSESEYFAQFTNRIYFPKFSKNTSLNIGLNYYNYKFVIPRAVSLGSDFEATQSLISVPFQLQHNFANKNIRPYAFIGMNISYLSVKDDEGNSIIEQRGLQSDFGLNFLFGGGIEVDLYKGLMLKGEYRYETFSHLMLFGIGYNFSK